TTATTDPGRIRLGGGPSPTSRSGAPPVMRVVVEVVMEAACASEDARRQGHLTPPPWDLRPCRERPSLPKMSVMEVDRNGLEVPTTEECLELVRRATIGRLAIHSGALPTIVPVNFVLTEEGIVIRTAPGSKLDNAVEHAVVAF